MQTSQGAKLDRETSSNVHVVVVFRGKIPRSVMEQRSVNEFSSSLYTCQRYSCICGENVLVCNEGARVCKCLHNALFLPTTESHDSVVEKPCEDTCIVYKIDSKKPLFFLDMQGTNNTLTEQQPNQIPILTFVLSRCMRSSAQYACVNSIN